MHKWHNVEVNPIPFSDVATTKPRRDQLKLPVMIHNPAYLFVDSFDGLCNTSSILVANEID